MAKTFKRGDRVKYVGKWAGALIGLHGTVKYYSSDGWVIVDFGPTNSTAKVDEDNLRLDF